jgi:hypothetical protein
MALGACRRSKSRQAKNRRNPMNPNGLLDFKKYFTGR